MDAKEIKLQLAIEDYRNGVYTSIKATAAAHNVPRTTLSDRLNGKTINRRKAHEHDQRLTPLQETFLVEWIHQLDECGNSPSHPKVKEMAEKILRMGGDDKPLGKRWIGGFLDRNNGVKSVIGRKMEAPRIEAATPYEIGQFFDLFKEVRDGYRVLPKNTWNMDETGLGTGVCGNSYVLTKSTKSKAHIKSPETREWVSMIEGGSATGARITTTVIFKGKDIQTTWFNKEKLQKTYFTTSTNGWTSNRIAFNWLKHVFLPETEPDDKAEWRILLLDGHGSHICADFMWECKQNKVHCIYLPAHTSHILQPLDLSCFSPLKTRYRKEIMALASLDDAAPVKKRRFLECYYKAREESFTDRVIRAGWKASGLHPFDPAKVLESSQVKGRPLTPPPQEEVDSEPFKTPKGPKDLYHLSQGIRGEVELERDVRMMLQKVTKRFEEYCTMNASLTAENAQLKLKLKDVQPQQRRKKVVPKPNEAFVTIEGVKEAIEEVEALEAKPKARKPKMKPKNVSVERNPLVLI